MSEQVEPSWRRSSHYYAARDALFKVLDLGTDNLKLDVVEAFFQYWQEEYSVRKYVRLRDNDEYVFVRMINRFCEEYRRKVWSKMDRFQTLKWDLMLSLTMDPKMFLNLGLEFERIGPAWDRLRSALTKSYGKFEFVRVLECQKSGRPHLHVLIKFVDWRGFYTRMYRGERLRVECQKPFIAQDHLTELWSSAVGGNGTTYVTSCSNNVNAIWYVVKYVRKSVAGVWYSALLFASNKRLWGVSGGLRRILNIHRPNESMQPRFRYDGSCTYGELKSYLDEKDKAIEDFVRVTASGSDYVDFRNVFDVWERG